MKARNKVERIDILLVEDNEGDILLVKEALELSENNYNLHVITNGEQVMDYLKQRGEFKDKRLPDLILLDLNLPRKNGKDILRDIKSDSDLEVIPIIIFTSSNAESDIVSCYKLKANSYVNKPADFLDYVNVIKNIKEYWNATVTLPPKTLLS